MENLEQNTWTQWGPREAGESERGARREEKRSKKNEQGQTPDAPRKGPRERGERKEGGMQGTINGAGKPGRGSHHSTDAMTIASGGPPCSCLKAVRASGMRECQSPLTFFQKGPTGDTDQSASLARVSAGS